MKIIRLRISIAADPALPSGGHLGGSVAFMDLDRLDPKSCDPAPKILLHFYSEARIDIDLIDKFEDFERLKGN
jgi:hypothetical protein